MPQKQRRNEMSKTLGETDSPAMFVGRLRVCLDPAIFIRCVRICIFLSPPADLGTMWSLVSVLCVAVLASAEPRFRRLAPCNNNWSLPTNPCKAGQTQVYFPHPSDPSSFLQCDMQGRMYMIRCPAGMLFSQATTSCQPQTTITTQPPTNPGTSSKFCTAQNIAAGRIYWAVPGMNNKFIECGPNGGATILTCPALLVWDQSKTSCVYATTNGKIPVTPTTPTGPVIGGPGAGFKNPCTSSSAVAGKLYYAYPDVHKFIQCDTNGDAFVVSCPGGLIWNTALETCFSPYQTAINAIG